MVHIDSINDVLTSPVKVLISFISNTMEFIFDTADVISLISELIVACITNPIDG